METILVGILIVLGILVVGTVVFGGWVIVSVLRLIGRGIGALTRRPAPVALPPAGLVRCGHLNCRTDNPKGARFCRRCGRIVMDGVRVALPPPPPTRLPNSTATGAPAESTVVRRVAMW